MADNDFKLRLQEIREMEEQIAARKSEIREAGIAEAQALIDSLDIDVSELRFSRSAKAPRRGGTVAPKYRGPNGETWSGRGRQPKWLTALVNNGRQLEEFEIK